MTRAIVQLTLILLAVAAAAAQERVTLSTPDALPAVSNYRVERVTLTVDDSATPADEGVILIQLMGVERAVPVSCTYSSATSPTGSTLITALNKANLSSAYAGNATTGSLVQRIFHRLVVMGEASAVCGRSISGSLTGSPQ